MSCIGIAPKVFRLAETRYFALEAESGRGQTIGTFEAVRGVSVRHFTARETVARAFAGAARYWPRRYSKTASVAVERRC